MPYRPELIAQIKSAPAGALGSRLGRWAVYHDISAQRIAYATGATRQSVYNWMRGGEILQAYRPAVERLIEIMQRSGAAEDTWSKICQALDLKY
jgi:hypothetical protein